MSRIQLDAPETYPFRTEIDVRITDINYGNHLGNDSVLSILHEARVRWLASKGFSEVDIGGCGVILADTAILFKNEVFYPATLACEVAAADVARSSFDLYYRVCRVEDGARVAEAKTGMIGFDYERKKPVRLPDRFREALLRG